METQTPILSSNPVFYAAFSKLFDLENEKGMRKVTVTLEFNEPIKLEIERYVLKNDNTFYANKDTEFKIETLKYRLTEIKENYRDPKDIDHGQGEESI